MTILIRCDSSNIIGGGHVKRCLTLAKELELRKQKVIFLTTNKKGNLNSEISNTFKLILIDKIQELKGNYEIDEYKNIYIKEDEILDAKLCINSIIANKINFIKAIILDSYTLGNEWIKQLKYFSSLNSIKIEKTMLINDFNSKASIFDLELNQNQLANQKEDNRLLHGFKYILLENCYKNKNFDIKDREIKKIMVFIGTSDTKNIIPYFLEIFRDEFFRNFNINFVLSEISPNYEKVKKIISEINNVNLYTSLPNLNQMIKQSDFIIGSGGTNTWERIYYNKPSLVVKIADNQDIVIKALALTNSAFIVEELPNKSNLYDIKNKLIDLLKNKSLLNKIAENSIPLVDGFGRSRVAFKLLGLIGKIHLKSASKEDSLLLYNWFVNPKIRSNSLVSKTVTFNEHNDWFQKQLTSELCLIYILTDEFNTPLGNIRLEKSDNNKEVKISYCLDFIARGIGISFKLVQLGISEAQKQWGGKLIFKGTIKDSNIPSIKTFIKLGFQKIQSNNKNEEYSDYCLK